MRLLLAILLLLVAAPACAQQGQGMSKAMVVSSCGGGALPSGALTNLTMNPAGQLCLTGIGGGSGHSAQALAYLARTVGGNEGGNGENIATLIDGLVADGVWASLDALYVLAQQNETDALLNLVGTSYGLTAVGLLRSVNFSSYVGFNNFAIGIYLNTGFDPVTAPSPNYQLNNASFGVWSYAVIQEAVCQMSGDGVSSSVIYNKFTDGNFISALNSSSGAYPRSPTAITKGLFVVERVDAANVHPYQNGASSTTISSSSAFVQDHTFWVGGGQADGFTSQTLSAAFIGASLGSAGQLALYNRLRTYMTAVGVP